MIDFSNRFDRTFEHLGCVIDRAQTMKLMVKHVTTQARAARGMLRPVISSKLLLRTRLLVYKTFVRSRLTYHQYANDPGSKATLKTPRYVRNDDP